jgi:hypothetical protein
MDPVLEPSRGGRSKHYRLSLAHGGYDGLREAAEFVGELQLVAMRSCPDALVGWMAYCFCNAEEGSL